MSDLNEKYEGWDKMKAQGMSDKLLGYIEKKKYGKKGAGHSKEEHKEMDKKMYEAVEIMVDHILAGNHLDAEQAFNVVIAGKVEAALENMKVDVSNKFFNGQVQEETELDEVAWSSLMKIDREIAKAEAAHKAAKTPETKAALSALWKKKAAANNAYMTRKEEVEDIEEVAGFNPNSAAATHRREMKADAIAKKKAKEEWAAKAAKAVCAKMPSLTKDEDEK